MGVGMCRGIGQRVSQKVQKAARGYMESVSSPAGNGGCDEVGVLGAYALVMLSRSLNRRPGWGGRAS